MFFIGVHALSAKGGSALFYIEKLSEKNSEIFFSETNGPIQLKFCVNDPWVILLQVYVFYLPTCISSQMRVRTVLHRKTIGKKFKDLL